MTITYPAYRQASKNGKDKGENSSMTVLASIPSYRFEEVRIGPSRRIIPQRPPGAGP